MHPLAPDIRDAVKTYFRLLEATTGSEDDALGRLADSLDRLMFLGRRAPDVGTEDDQPDPPAADCHHYRDLASKRFPSLGYYNCAGDVTHSLGETECVVGDAIDDLADIAGDLSEVLWCFENTADLDALWHFRFGYEHHWGKHASDLRWYLYALWKER